MKKILIAFILWIMLIVPSTAQSCFISLSELSGFNTSEFQASLEQAACSIKTSLPVQYQNDFKVFDFGFYLHNETFNGFGYPEAFEKAIDKVEALSPYFVLIGKQTDSKGIYSGFYVNVKLPDITGNSCLPNLNSFAANLLKLEIEKEYEENGRIPNLYANAYEKGFDQFKIFLQNAVVCCQQGGDIEQCLSCNNPGYISAQLSSMGFVKETISNITSIPLNSSGAIEDYAGLKFDAVELSGLDVPNNYTIPVSILQARGLTVKVFITKDETVCTSNWNTIKTTANGGQYDVVFWHHIHKGEEIIGDEILFSRVYFKNQNGNRNIAERSFGPDPVSTLLGALGAAAADALIQTTVYYLTDDSIKKGEWGKAFDKVNWGSVAWSGFIGLFTITSKAFLAGSAVCDGIATISYKSYRGDYANDPNWKSSMTRDFTATFLGHLIGVSVGNAITTKLSNVNITYLTTKGWMKLYTILGRNFLIDNSLIQQMTQQGINFTQNALKFTVKNKHGSIIFLETGSSSAGLQHIIERHWANQLSKFFNNQDEMIEYLFIALRDRNFVSKLPKNNGFEFIYEIETKLGMRQFKLAAGSNGFVVTFFPI